MHVDLFSIIDDFQKLQPASVSKPRWQHLRRLRSSQNFVRPPLAIPFYAKFTKSAEEPHFPAHLQFLIF